LRDILYLKLQKKMDEQEQKFLDYIDQEYEELYENQVGKEYTYYDQKEMHNKW